MKEYIEMIRDGKNRIKTDCDCNACLLIALARAMGIPARMITASGIDENNKESAHGWTEAYYSDLNLKTGWQVWDTTTGECYNMDYRGYTQQLKKSFFKEINSVKDECGVDRSPDYLAPAKKPDIIIEDISWEPKNPKEGDTVTIYVKVKNQGSGDAGEFYLDYYLEDKHYDRNFINNLSAGSSITASFAWTAKCGNWLIDVFSDYNQQVDESNETNNDRHEVIEIEYPKDAPDIVVTEIDWKPLYPKAGDSVKITATIANKGNRDAGGFYVGAFIDSSELYDNPDSVAYISSLSVGSTITTSFIWNVTQDEARHISHYIRIFADCNRAVSESNENNNKRTAIINVDEEPENVKFIGMLIRVNTPMGFSAYYFKVNKVIEGPILVGDVVRVFVWTSAQPEFLHNYDRLNISEKAEVYAEFEEELGKHYDNHVNCEVWGADITYSERYYVKKIEEKPDLIISDISMSPSSPKQGDDVKFTVTVKNIGKGTAKKSTTLIYLINGNKQTLLFLDFPSCPPLGPGVTHTYTKNAKIEDCGEYRFRAFVDVSKEVDESNEENNRRVKSFTVPCPKEKPDLTIQSISSKPENLKQGDYARFHIYIKNVGKGAAKQSYARVIVRRAISKEANIWETILDTTDLVLSLEPGKIFDDYQDVRINKCGEYKITVFVDAKHELDESDTDNNFATKSFSISGIPIYIDVHNVKTSNGYLNLPGAGTLYLYVYDSTLKRDADVAHVNFKNSPAYITVPIKVSEDIKYIRVKQWPAIKDGMFEDWGLMQISPITKNKVYTYIRSNPWITDVTFNGKHSWEVIDLNKKQEVPIRVTVKNPSANELKVKVKFYLDRNEEKAWDYSAVSDSVSIQPKGSHEFTFTYNKESTKGTWRFRVIAYNGNGYVTDQYAWTKIKGGNEKYFDPKVDGYSFSNHEAAEATVNELKNKKTFVLELLKIFPPVKEAVRKYYEKKITESDRGVCAGLSISSAEYYLKSELKPVEKNTHDMQLTNVKVLQKILYYQKGRWKLSSLFSKPNERNEYEKIKRFASEQKPMLLLLGVDGNKDPVSWTHEVVGICPCQESGNYAYIEIYDCNYPSRTSIIKMDLGENRIYYKDYKYLKVDEL
jgi:subtilase family serine protease